jgi:hypothetical protein
MESYSAVSLLPYVAGSAAIFLIMPYIWAYLGRSLLKKKYTEWAAVKQIEWSNRLSSMLHLAVILPAVFYLIANDPALSSPDLFVLSWKASVAVSFSCGYFVWDLIEVTSHPEVNGVPFLIHAIYCLGVYGIATFRQLMLRHALLYLLFEVSTIFFNLHWFFTVPYSAPGWAITANGIFMISTYFGFRICFGYYHTATVFWPDAWSLLTRVPQVDSMTYGMVVYVLFASLVANSLNTIWFGMIIKSIIRGNRNTKEVKKD